MTNKEMVIDILKTYSCLTSFQIKGQIYRKFGELLSPSSISGIMRPLISAGYAANSKDDHGKTVYWLTSIGKEKV